MLKSYWLLDRIVIKLMVSGNIPINVLHEIYH